MIAADAIMSSGRDDAFGTASPLCVEGCRHPVSVGWRLCFLFLLVQAATEADRFQYKRCNHYDHRDNLEVSHDLPSFAFVKHQKRKAKRHRFPSVGKSWTSAAIISHDFQIVNNESRPRIRRSGRIFTLKKISLCRLTAVFSGAIMSSGRDDAFWTASPLLLGESRYPIALDGGFGLLNFLL